MAAYSWVLPPRFMQRKDGADLSDEDDGLSRSRRTSTATEFSSFPDDHSSGEDSPFNSLGDDWESLGPAAIQFMKQLQHEKNLQRTAKKPKDQYTKQHKQLAQKGRVNAGSGSRRHSKDNSGQVSALKSETDDQAIMDAGDNNANDLQKKIHISKRKRSVNQLRASERDAKIAFEIADTVPESPDSAVPLLLTQPQESVKVDTHNHFRSLNSQPVIPKELQGGGSGLLTPHKPPSQDCAKERLDFYLLFATLIKMGNCEPKQVKEEHNFTRQVREPAELERSREEQIWQNKLNDLLWLELRAWHNGRKSMEEDQALLSEREQIGKVLDEVMDFVFVPAVTEDCCKNADNCVAHFSLEETPEEAGQAEAESAEFQQPSQTNTTKPPRPSLDLTIIPNPNDVTSALPSPSPTEWNPGYICCGFCHVSCYNCLMNQNEALRQVKELLDKLDDVERLYPSSKAMMKQWPLYKDLDFNRRVRTLCLFYNLMTDLRQKIATLGKMLSSFSGESLPWPAFMVPETIQNTVTPSSPCQDDSEKRERRPSKCVRFLSEEDNSMSVLNTGTSLASNSISTDSGIARSASSGGSASVNGNAKDCDGNPWNWNSSPSFQSTPRSGTPSDDVGSLQRSLSEMSNSFSISPYRRYVDKLLKQKGLRKLLQRLLGFINNTLERAKQALEIHPNITRVTSPDLPPTVEDSPPPLIDDEQVADDVEDWGEELWHYGAWSDSYKNMSLPSFRALYLFLLHLPIEIMHECLQLRLEHQPEEPSALSIRQVMRECKETIKASIIIRQKYVQMARAVLSKPDMEKIEQGLIDYDDHVKKMLQSYLKYLQSWVRMLLKSTQQTEKNVLEEEWKFVKHFSRYVQRGEALASEMFCSMSSNMLASAGNYLETGTDNCTSFLYDWMNLDKDIAPTPRHKSILQLCRDFKDLFQEARKRALKAIAFSKMLRKDLEIAAEFVIESTCNKLLERLLETNHVRLIAPHSSNFMIFIPDHVKDNHSYLWQLLSMTYGHEHSAAPNDTETEGYLVILCCDRCENGLTHWTGPTAYIEPTAEITITLSHLRVEGLLLVVNHSSQLGVQRKVFQKAMGPIVSITKEFTSCNQSIADSLLDLKKEAMSLRDKITDAICVVEDRLNLDNISDLEETEKLNLQARCREIIHQCYKFGFEYHKEMTRLVTGEARGKLGPGLMNFAKQWMNFVFTRFERGRGVRPKWANQGLDFLMTACEPIYLKQLSEDEFRSFKQIMNDSITHLIGSADTKQLTSYSTGSASRSQSPSSSRPGSFRHSSSYVEPPRSSSLPRTTSTVSSKSEPIILISEDDGHPRVPEEVDQDDDSSDISEPETPIDRVRAAVYLLDLEREAELAKNKLIGRVYGTLVETTVRISARRVTFSWQRGMKLGQGRFGKVYTAVNNDTGDLMALKEIHLQPNDHKTIKEVADELRIFEGIRHKYLVRYFGVEIHREEMFIFMEYCDCGTLENEARHGLPEAEIRKYTRQLLEATAVLHENGIVHRDIKGANIFLTSDGNLKLGDFGCCIKLKNHTTMPGELNSFVGTQAFMAPEVFTKSGGHGRAADIWSIGCVVVEMATGKRPWPELENNYQIMFKVGTGECPEMPNSLSDEGIDFLSHCFQFDPKERWTAIMLLDHPFTKVDSEDECQSITILAETHRPIRQALGSALTG